MASEGTGAIVPPTATQNNTSMMSSTSSGASEIIYGGDKGSIASDESRVMSEKVQQLASEIYRELELIIKNFGQGAVKDLMPLVVNVLESLDLNYLEKEEQEVEFELLKEDNEQLMTQYEREKQLRRMADQKCMEIEDNFEAEQKELRDKVESLESIVRMLELKSKNAADHSFRLEERENELKQEYAKLHERYTDLFKTHMDYMERTKFLMGSDKFDMISSLPASQAEARQRLGMASSMDPSAMHGVSDVMQASTHSLPPTKAQSIAAEIDAWQNDELSASSAAEILGTEPGNKELVSPRNENNAPLRQVSETVDQTGEPHDLTGNLVDAAEFASAETSSDCSDENNSEMLSRASETSTQGMGREVENLIKENTELLETKNALNVVKNDLIAQVDQLSSEQEILREEIRSLEMVRARMADKIKELEDEMRQIRDKMDENRNENDQEDVPMAQRKRFTRVEMARVLMERNQYKEKLMELQDAVRWTEMMRANRADQGIKGKGKNKAGIWDFFSGLFGAEQKSPREVKYEGGRARLKSTEAPSKKKETAEKLRSLGILDSEHQSEKRAMERKEQYKLVRAHVKKDSTGRIQAYGWSLPAVETNQPAVPVPVYCRPLIDQQPNLKIWCATGIRLKGGRTKDGGFIVGSSVFYSQPAKAPNFNSDQKPIEKLDSELKDQLEEFAEFHGAEWESSSLMWVCSSAHGQSQVSVLDANNPAEIFESFYACNSHLLCIASVQGVSESDYPCEGSENMDSLCNPGTKDEEQDGFMVGKVEWLELTKHDDGTFCAPDMTPTPKRGAPKESSSPTKDAQNTPIVVSPEKHSDKQAGLLMLSEVAKQMLPQHIRDGLNVYCDVAGVSTLLPTVWMGSQGGYLYIHSAVSEWRKCLRKIKMQDAVLSIVHYKGRVFVALANGTIAVFHRQQSGEWSTCGFYSVTLGNQQHSIRCVQVVASRIWCAFRNYIYVFDSNNLQIQSRLCVHPRKESQVRELVWVGDGVWCSIRLDSTLRLYHAHTFQHLQDVDIEPCVCKMLGTSKLGFSMIRITSLLVSCNRLWIGTGNGVIISVPLSQANQTKVDTVIEGGDGLKGPGGLVRVYSDPLGTDRVSPGSFIPYCNMTHAQLSFHGHKDAVKFIVAVPGTPSVPSTSNPNTSESEIAPERRMMIVCGGDGYIDFRLGEDEENEEGAEGHSAPSPRDMSHLIVWEVPD